MAAETVATSPNGEQPTADDEATAPIVVLAELPARAGIATRLAHAIAHTHRVAKDGRNTFHNYDYASAEAVLAAVREPLAQAGLVLLPTLVEVIERDYTTAKNKASTLTDVVVDFTLLSVDGDERVMRWRGRGDDNADKGLGKAYTTLVKTFVRQLLLLPTGDDPEADAATDQRAAARDGQGQARPAVTAQPQTNGNGERLASAAQKRMIFARGQEAGIPAMRLCNLILAVGGGEVRTYENAEQADDHLKRMMDRLPARFVDPVLAAVKKDQEAMPTPPDGMTADPVIGAPDQPKAPPAEPAAEPTPAEQDNQDAERAELTAQAARAAAEAEAAAQPAEQHGGTGPAIDGDGPSTAGSAVDDNGNPIPW